MADFAQFFSEQMEKALVVHTLEVSGRFHGLTSEQLRKLAYEFAQRNNLPHKFDTATKMAGVDWLS